MGAENEDWLWFTDSFYGLRGTVSFYGCRKRTLSTVAEVFHNEVRISHSLFTKNYTGDFEIAPSNMLFRCILSYPPCTYALGYRIMFPIIQSLGYRITFPIA
jgi:hypothetical protein